MPDQAVAFGRELDIAPYTIKQAYAEVGFQQLDAGADGCLGQVQRLGRLTKVTRTVYLEKGA